MDQCFTAIEGFYDIDFKCSWNLEKTGIKHTFREAQGKLTINWWQTNKTLHVQGSQDTVEEYEEQLSELILEGKSKSDSPEEITDTTKNDQGNASNVKKANKKKGKKSGGNEEVLDNGKVVKIWEVINALKMSVISLTERFENMAETEGADIIKELPQAQLYEAKAKIDDLQSLNCALETENMELKNQVTRMIKKTMN